MTRLELITVLVARARSNGFEFRRWYTAKLSLPWISTEAALILLDQQRRYYALFFSHEFAISFWKAGEDISFAMPERTFKRVKPDGTILTVTRKPYQRRSTRQTAWKYHLREMAAAEEPLRYLRRYLNIEDELALGEPQPDDGTAPPKIAAPPRKPVLAKRPGPVPRPIANAIPTDVPAFLRRPYP